MMRRSFCYNFREILWSMRGWRVMGDVVVSTAMAVGAALIAIIIVGLSLIVGYACAEIGLPLTFFGVWLGAIVYLVFVE